MSRYTNDDGTIKWTKQDEERLKKAINNFNSKRQRLINNEKKLDKENKIISNTIERERYSEVKKEILTRDELNKYIKSLRDFSKRGAEEIDEKHYEKTGQKISKWQHKVIKKNIKIAKARLEKDLEPYKKIVEDSGGLSKIDMKNTEAQDIIDRIEALGNYVNKTDYDFRKKFKSLQRQGSLDYNLKKAILYRDNYIETMKKYKGRPHYEEFMKRLKSKEFTSNPKAFYDFISEDEDASDLYKQSDENLAQAELEELMRKWGTQFEDDDEIQEEIDEDVENFYKQYKYSLIEKASGKIIAQSNDINYLRNLSKKIKGVTYIQLN